MNKEIKQFLSKLSLETPLSEIKKYCTNEEDTIIIMNHLYSIMYLDKDRELREDLQFTFSGERVYKKEKPKLSSLEWNEILDSYKNAKEKKEKESAIKKMMQVLDGKIEIEREKEKVDIESEANLFLKAKELFINTPVSEIKTSLIQKKMNIGYAKAVKVKDFLTKNNG